MQRRARVLRGGGSLALVMATIVACGGDPNMPDSATGDGGGGRVETGLPDARRDAIVIDGGKMLQSGGGGANTAAMLDWTDEQWDALRPKKK